jgi:hypothetical protein
MDVCSVDGCHLSRRGAHPCESGTSPCVCSGTMMTKMQTHCLSVWCSEVTDDFRQSNPAGSHVYAYYKESDRHTGSKMHA